MKKYTVLFLFGIILCLGIYLYIRTLSSATVSSGQGEVVFGTQRFVVEIVSTPDALEKGLSGHRPLTQREGMLFAFPKPDRYGFWMKEMTFPIDIIWLDENKKVVYIEKSVLPSTYPTVFYPPVDARFVLEILDGQSEIAGIRVGDFATVSNVATK